MPTCQHWRHHSGIYFPRGVNLGNLWKWIILDTQFALFKGPALYLSDVFIWDAISWLIDMLRVTQFFLEISWISTCVSLFHPVFLKVFFSTTIPLYMTMSKKQTYCSTNEDYWRLPERFKSNGRMMVWQIPSPEQNANCIGNSRFTNLLWMIKNLNWMIETIKTAQWTWYIFEWDCWFVHRILDFGARLKVGSSNAFGMEVRNPKWPTTASSDGFYAHPRFFEASETWNRQNPPQITLFFEG